MKSYLSAVFLAIAVILLEVQSASLSPFFNDDFESFGLLQSGLAKREAIETGLEEGAVNMKNFQSEINPALRKERDADLLLAAAPEEQPMENVELSDQQRAERDADLEALGVKGGKAEEESGTEQQPKEIQDQQFREARDADLALAAAPAEEQPMEKDVINAAQRAERDADLAALGIKGAEDEGKSGGENPKEIQQQDSQQREARDAKSAVAAEEQPKKQRAERDADLAAPSVKGAKE